MGCCGKVSCYSYGKRNTEKTIFTDCGNIGTRRIDSEKGTIVDSTIIKAPTSTKNKEKKRDPEAHSTKKGNTSHFGYKAHIGVDSKTGLVHTVKATSANVHDVTVISELLRCEEKFVYGDSGYLGAEKGEDAVIKNNNGKEMLKLLQEKYEINSAQELSME